MTLWIAPLLLATVLPQDPGEPKQKGRGLHGYIGYSATQPADRAKYGMGMGFYSAAWSLIVLA